MKHRREIRTTITLMTVLLLSGCAYPGGTMTNPNDDALSPPDGLSTKPASELLDETVKHTDELVQLIGGEWLDAGSPPGVFDVTNLSPWRHPDPCDMTGTAEQYVTHIWQDPPPGTELDPFAHVAKVRAHWETLGYTIRQIGPPEQSPTKGHSIVVDLPNNGGLSFFASTQVLGISVQSECTAISR